jgi:DNA-binding NarL/FixJ family response regulator
MALRAPGFGRDGGEPSRAKRERDPDRPLAARPGDSQTSTALRWRPAAIREKGKGVISVALIEDNHLVRQGISSLLSQSPDLEVVVAAGSGDTERLRAANPGVILLDLGLRSADSLRLTQKVRQELPEARIIVMDLLPVHEDIVDFVHAGVAGFILKDATLDDLLRTIRSVAEGEHVLPPPLTSTLFSQIARDAVVRGRPVVLDSVRMTPREREVIGLIADGLSNKAIGAELRISPHTVKSHVRNIMEKLALHTRLQIAAYAHGRGEAERD